jgi:hypothetical protein
VEPRVLPADLSDRVEELEAIVARLTEAVEKLSGSTR